MGSNTYHMSQGLPNIKPYKKQKVSLTRWRKTEEPQKEEFQGHTSKLPHIYTMNVTKPIDYINLVYSSNIVHRMHRTVDIFFFIFSSWYISSSSSLSSLGKLMFYL